MATAEGADGSVEDEAGSGSVAAEGWIASIRMPGDERMDVSSYMILRFALWIMSLEI
jgi:hypothetical protein